MIPTLDPKHITGNQTTRFPHMLGYIDDYKVRYRIVVDASYLVQSTAAIDVWNAETNQWNELWTLLLDTEFTVSDSTTLKKDLIEPDSTILANVHHRNGSAFIAETWNKIVQLLHERGRQVLV